MKKEIGGPAAIALVIGAAAVILLGGYFLFFRPEKPIPYEEQQAKMQKLFDKESCIRGHHSLAAQPFTSLDPSFRLSAPAGDGRA